MRSLELLHIISAIFIGTAVINVAIALIRNKLPRKQRVPVDAHWERKMDEAAAEEAMQRASESRRYRCLSIASSRRGFLHDLAARESFVNGKLCESDMITTVQRMMREVRLKFDEVVYLGKHTSKGRESDACLYARYRSNGMTRCIGEVASLRQGRHGDHIMVSLTNTDAALVQEKGWGVPSGRTFGQLATYFNTARATEIVMPMPRNSEELRTIIQPVLEAAICSIARVEPCA